MTRFTDSTTHTQVTRDSNRRGKRRKQYTKSKQVKVWISSDSKHFHTVKICMGFKRLSTSDWKESPWVCIIFFNLYYFFYLSKQKMQSISKRRTLIEKRVHDNKVTEDFWNPSGILLHLKAIMLIVWLSLDSLRVKLENGTTCFENCFMSATLKRRPIYSESWIYLAVKCPSPPNRWEMGQWTQNHTCIGIDRATRCSGIRENVCPNFAQSTIEKRNQTGSSQGIRAGE